MFDSNGRYRLLMPVRRKLCFAVVSWFLGILLSSACPLPFWTGFIGAVFSIGLFLFLHRMAMHRLPAVMLAMFCMGFSAAGFILQSKALPTRSKAEIQGTICFIQDDSHVFLKDVSVDGIPWAARGFLVTLMRDSYDDPNTGIDIQTGQTISGIGRLFTQREKSNPGGYDNRISAICKGYELSGYLLPGWTTTGIGRFSLGQFFEALRGKLVLQLQMIFGDDAPLFEAILLGDRSDLEYEAIVSMRLTGIVHILTVSGMHLSLLAALLDRLLRKMRLPRLARCGVLAFLLSFYTLLTGAAAGTIRALIMRIIADFARMRGKRYDALTSLAAAALLMTLYNPVWVLDASFQFSFYTVLGLLLLHRSMMCMFERLVPARPIWLSYPLLVVADTVAVSASAQLACLPMQAMAYGYVPLLSLPMNLIGGLLILPILYGGAFVLIIGFLSLRAAQCCAFPCILAARLLKEISDFLASQPMSILRIPAPFSLIVLVAPLLMMLFCRNIAFGYLRKKAALFLAACLAFAFSIRFIPVNAYVQLDVGQGDAAVIRSGRHAMLVDVGPDSNYDVIHYLRHEGLMVDALVLSHFDSDHAGALLSLLRSEIEIPQIICPTGINESEIGSQVVLNALSLADEKGIPIQGMERGDQINFGHYSFHVLSPTDALTGENDRSLVLYADLDGTSFLLTGDLPNKCERNDFPDVQVLKVAHHGSKNATSPELIAQTTPEIALISVGAGNSYGHPTQRVLEDLSNANAQIWRTDESGCLTLWLLKNKYFIQPFHR